MTIAIAVISVLALVLVVLVLIWKVGRVRCRDCAHYSEQYISSYLGQGLFRFGYCQKEVHTCKMVETDIERECRYFKRRLDEKVLGEIALPDTKGVESGES